MKPITVQHSGKGWNARVVAAQDMNTFVNDEAHAIEGLNADDNKKALQAVHKACTAAVEKADSEPEAAKELED